MQASPGAVAGGHVPSALGSRLATRPAPAAPPPPPGPRAAARPHRLTRALPRGSQVLAVLERHHAVLFVRHGLRRWAAAAGARMGPRLARQGDQTLPAATILNRRSVLLTASACRAWHADWLNSRVRHSSPPTVIPACPRRRPVPPECQEPGGDPGAPHVHGPLHDGATLLPGLPLVSVQRVG